MPPQPMPATPYVDAKWRNVRPDVDYLIEIGKGCATFPHALGRMVLGIGVTNMTVEVMRQRQRIALHPRSTTERSAS